MRKVWCFLLTVSILICCLCVPSFAASSLKLTSENYPTSYTEGSTFSVYGVITSDTNISSVTVGAYNSSGVAQFEYTAKPGVKSYNIHSIDYLLTFSKLVAGTYTYKIVASDANSKNVVLLNKTFTVSASHRAEDDLTAENMDFIDLSVWNDITSWDKVGKAVDGVILRIGYRSTGTHKIGIDKKFAEFYKNAVAQGLHVGVYFYSAALTSEEATEEAEYVISVLKDNSCKPDMPVYIDLETSDQVALSQDACTQVARAFCDKIISNGYYPGIYCSKYFARDEINMSKLSDVTLWVAQYASTCSYVGSYGMWQYSDSGTISGINGNVDLDYCYYDYPTYIKSKGYNGYTTDPGLTTTGTYSFKASDNLAVNKANKTVCGMLCGVSAELFKSNYIESSKNVTVTITGTVSSMVATGSVIYFKNGSTTLDSYTIIVVGDVDSNAAVNSADALTVLQAAVGTKSLTGIKKIAADYNEDGQVNSTDALDILKYSVGS